MHLMVEAEDGNVTYLLNHRGMIWVCGLLVAFLVSWQIQWSAVTEETASQVEYTWSNVYAWAFGAAPVYERRFTNDGILEGQLAGGHRVGTWLYRSNGKISELSIRIDGPDDAKSILRVADRQNPTWNSRSSAAR